MSLDKKKQVVPKKVSVVGNKEDFNSLADVLEQSKEMFNVDIDGKKDDVPSRIHLRKEIDPDAISYPRTAKALKKVAEGLRLSMHGDKEQTIHVTIGSDDWMLQDPNSVHYSKDTIRALQSITMGRSAAGLRPVDPAKHYAGRDVMQELDNMLAFRKWPDNLQGPGGADNGLFRRLKPEWTYIQTAEVHPRLALAWKDPKKFKDIRGIRDLEDERMRGNAAYPPNLGEILNAKGKKVPATQAFVVAFRGDVEFDPEQKVQIDTRVWNNFVRNLPAGMMSKELTKDKPKTIGDLLKVFFVYNTASLMKLKDGTVRPLTTGRSPIMTEHIHDGGREPTVPGMPPPRIIGERVLYSALVVGTGRYIPATYDAWNLPEAQIPGWN